jgi:uracil phosphoribosyltransferase
VADWPNLHVSQHPAVRHKLGILRDEKTEPKKFREVVRELSWLLGYEALADARTRDLDVRTPMEPMAGEELADRIGLVPILRAGLGMVDAFLELMPTCAGVAPRPVPRRADASTGRVLQQAAR